MLEKALASIGMHILGKHQEVIHTQNICRLFPFHYLDIPGSGGNVRYQGIAYGKRQINERIFVTSDLSKTLLRQSCTPSNTLAWTHVFNELWVKKPQPFVF